MFEDPNQLYCDGGVIEKNPSKKGGTWAAKLIQGGKVVRARGGIITPAQAQMETVSNNLTEMLALVRGLEMLPDDWSGTVYSDSQVTLGRGLSEKRTRRRSEGQTWTTEKSSDQ